MSPNNNVSFNPAQLASWKEAREYAERLSHGPISVGGGVLAETNDPQTSGIYLPEWLAGPGGFAEPSGQNPRTGEPTFFLHYRFKNGAEGMNVGLVIDRFRRYPASPMYVLGTLAEEAERLATGVF